MKINEITALAVNKWDYIFNSLGLEVGNGKHCACPVCGGKDRFRLDNKGGRGTWICNKCGAGDGLELLKNYFYCDAKEASSKVAECLNMNQAHNKINISKNVNSNKQQKKDLKSDPKNNMRDNSIFKKVEYLLSQSKLGQSEYLTNKGLSFELPLLDSKIFAPLININGKYTGAQFIESNGRKQLMKGTNKKGSFIAIYGKLLTSIEVCSKLSVSNEIVICEGLATGITLSLIKPQSLIITAIDAGNLIHVGKIIREVNQKAKIIIAGDNDIGDGQNIGLDKAISTAKAINGYYSVPNTDYKCDWDDYRQKYTADKAAMAFSENINRLEYAVSKKKAVPDLSQMQASQRADVLIEHYDQSLALDEYSNEVYIYKNELWEIVAEMELKRELAKLYKQSNLHYSERGIKSTIDTMKLSLPLKGTQPSNLIGFNNGIFDLTDRKFKPHKKDNWLQTINRVDFFIGGDCSNLESCAPNFYKWLNHVAKGCTAKMNRLKAALYMILTKKHDWQLFLEVTGAGGSGKSLFAEIATMLAGEQNTVSASMENIETVKGRSLLIDRSFIILPDQPRYIGSGAGLKAITGGDDVTIERKYIDPHSSKINAVVLIINNAPMRFDNDDNGIARRRVIFCFNDIVPASKRDPKLKNKIKTELSIIIRHLLDNFTDEKAKELLLKQQQSQESLEVKKIANPLIDFCSYFTAGDKPNGMLIGNKNSVKQYRRFLYHAYLEYMESNNLKMVLGRQNFMNDLKAALHENGMEFKQSERTKEGFRTNLYLDEDKAVDWLPMAADENISNNKRGDKNGSNIKRY